MRRDLKTFLRENLLGLSLIMIGLLCLVATLMVKVGEPGHFFPGFAFVDGQSLSGPEFDDLEKQNRAYEKIARTVTPAIANIRTTQVIRVQQSPFFADPFFRQFFGDMFGQSGIPREQREHALGSGVILSADGYIITNNHVIAKASEIEVMLSDRRMFKAKVIGADPRSDVAVIKIEGKDLPTVPWGDSSTLKPGAIVMAFGNPFGLSFTVTRGSVNAVGRSGLGIEDYEDFIQTDAAINPGNSGGPLFNMAGEVIGVNTAVIASGKGIGFSIPADYIAELARSTARMKDPARGWLGIYVEDMTEQQASLLGMPAPSGTFVDEVLDSTPASNAGLVKGDLILKADGEQVRNGRHLSRIVASTKPGDMIRMTILRGKKPQTVDVIVGTQPN